MQSLADGDLKGPRRAFETRLSRGQRILSRLQRHEIVIAGTGSRRSPSDVGGCAPNLHRRLRHGQAGRIRDCPDDGRRLKLSETGDGSTQKKRDSRNEMSQFVIPQ